MIRILMYGSLLLAVACFFYNLQQENAELLVETSETVFCGGDGQSSWSHVSFDEILPLRFTGGASYECTLNCSMNCDHARSICATDYHSTSYAKTEHEFGLSGVRHSPAHSIIVSRDDEKRRDTESMFIRVYTPGSVPDATGFSATLRERLTVPHYRWWMKCDNVDAAGSVLLYTMFVFLFVECVLVRC